MLPARRAEATVNVRRDGSADAGRREGRPATAAEDWLRIRELLRAALEKDPGQRSAFLDDACAGDAALRQSVDALLAAHEEAGDFLESPNQVDRMAAQVLGDEGAPALAAGSRVGRYEILELLDAGGMGVGIELLRTMTDEVRHHVRPDGGNELTLVRSIDGPAEEG